MEIAITNNWHPTCLNSLGMTYRFRFHSSVAMPPRKTHDGRGHDHP